MPDLKLGAQLYTVREYTQNEEDFAKTMEKIASIGYRYVQVSGIGGTISPEFIKKAAKDNGLKVTLTHTSPQKIRDETEKVIEEHDIFGCDGIGVGGMFGHERTEEGFKQFALDFGPAIGKIKQSGKVFLYHNHRFEFEKFNGKTGMEILLENTDEDGFMLTFDTYWAQAGGVDPASFIKRHSGRIFATHLKDMNVSNDKIGMTEVCTGNMNFKRILKVSAKNDVIWHFVEQDEVHMNAFESMKISYDNLMATGKFKD
ncbi:MAG: sugar phosphate isomerase/epimerase [Oscillospiraceae bacterium]|nr:sugar phosphate isomerase/epimerase [Oscillospiraceae bacterium]